MWQDKLFKLSGMVFAQAKYTPEVWLRVTGVDPLLFPSFISFTQDGLCIWTARAERLYQQHRAQVRANLASLGVQNG